ncbi:MAG: hypothetical protein GX044_11110 [Firmicutes bacterium]|nr:hypothetical protein [Bacillota bacterium]
MKAFDRIYGGIVIGLALLTLPFLLGWWASYLLQFNIIAGAMAGIGAGIGIAAILTKRIASQFYNLNTILLVLLFLFYEMAIFGFSMGVPIFNILPGIMAGVYTGRKSGLNGDDSITFEKELKKASLFSAVVLLIIALISACLAVSDPHTAANLQGMLKLGFPVTQAMIWGLIICGGAVLIIAQHILSIKAGRLAYRKAL